MRVLRLVRCNLQDRSLARGALRLIGAGRRQLRDREMGSGVHLPYCCSPVRQQIDMGWLVEGPGPWGALRLERLARKVQGYSLGQGAEVQGTELDVQAAGTGMGSVEVATTTAAARPWGPHVVDDVVEVEVDRGQGPHVEPARIPRAEAQHT